VKRAKSRMFEDVMREWRATAVTALEQALSEMPDVDDGGDLHSVDQIVAIAVGDLLGRAMIALVRAGMDPTRKALIRATSEMLASRATSSERNNIAASAYVEAARIVLRSYLDHKQPGVDRCDAWLVGFCGKHDCFELAWLTVQDHGLAPRVA
jgi:hypothetical protein